MQARLLLLLMILLMIEMSARAIAQTPSASADAVLATPTPSPPTSSAKLLTAFLAREAAGESANSFTIETPKIYLRWQGETLNAGDNIRCIWIAENVGAAAPANYHVDEATTRANEPYAAGTFTLSKPKTGWPEGTYRAEIYVGTKLVEAIPFTIERLRGD